MKGRFGLEQVEDLIVRDAKFLVTAVSVLLVLIIYVNQILVHSLVVGVTASLIFLSLNTIILGKTFFKSESAFVRIVFGSFVLLLIVGVIGWITLIIHNLDVHRTSVALLIVAMLCSVINKSKH